MKREYVDFGFIPERQLPMHWRLENWARWFHDGTGATVAPMFRQYRSSDVYEAAPTKMQTDGADAAKIAQAVAALPSPQRMALSWWYVKPVAPLKACRGLGCTMQELAHLVIDARAILMRLHTPVSA